MTEQDLFNFLEKNLKIQIVNNSDPVTCGGEVDGTLGVKVMLLLKNPTTGKDVIIDTDKCDIWY